MKEVVVCVIVILIIVLCILLNRQMVEPFSNNDFMICMFLTGGLKEEAENSIQTLKNIKLDDKLVVTTLDDEAYNHINKLGVKTEQRKTNLKKEANFGTKDFYEITIHKLDIIRESIETHNKMVVYTDTDIVFLKDISDDIYKFKNSHYDIMIQNDTNRFNEADKGNLCTGFIMFKPNKKCIKVLKDAKQLMLDNWDNRKWDTGGGADQKAMNISIKENKCSVGTFDLMDYPNGSRYFDNNHKFKTHTPKMIHNNYIVGTKNKIERFKKYGLWFISKPKLYGTKYGGFYLPDNLVPKKKDVVYYGIGVGEDVSFDVIISKIFNCNAYLVDPTPRSKKHYEKVSSFLNNNKVDYVTSEGGGNNKYWDIIANNKVDSSKLNFDFCGIGTKNDFLKFYMNKNPNYVSGSFNPNMNFVNKNNFINVNIKTIDNIMKKYNHSHIDILKLDIEGLEIDVLNYTFDLNIFPDIICVDFDSVREGKNKKEFELLKKRLSNYNLYYNDNYDITFIKHNQTLF